MSRQFEQYHSYEISISQEPNPADHATLIGSGDLIVRWSDGRGRRYEDLDEISECLVLLDLSVIRGAMKSSTKLGTYISYDHGHLLDDGESYVAITGMTLSTATDCV
jgi:hypothetical protein